MHQFFVKRSEIGNTPIVITGKDYHHMRKVLRLKKGERVLLCDGEGGEYLCSIAGYQVEAERVMLDVLDFSKSAGELPAQITLFQGYPKGDKMDLIIQKAVELGAYEIVPVRMSRSVVKLDTNKAQKKTQRWNLVAESAAKQSKRGRIPEVRNVMTMEEAVALAAGMDYILLPYEQAEGMEHSRKLLREARGKRSIGIFIGPEGGLEPSEVEQIEAIGGRTLSLGNRILRTETAGMTVLSLLMFLLEE